MRALVEKLFGKDADAVWAGWVTAVFTFLVAVLALATEALQELFVWASTSGREPLPDVSTIGYAVVAAIFALAVGVVNAVFRVIQNRMKVGRVPEYVDTESKLLDEA